MRPAVRALRAVLWTVGVFGGLWLVDRALFAPEAPRGWQRAAALAQVPARAGAALTPAYLPAELGWPPTLIQWQSAPEPGWWLSWGATGQTQVWIGAGALPPNHPAPGCLGDGACPAGWHALSRRFGAETVSVAGTLAPQQLRRMVDGLRPTDR